jgi:hypothetical protein
MRMVERQATTQAAAGRQQHPASAAATHDAQLLSSKEAHDSKEHLGAGHWEAVVSLRHASATGITSSPSRHHSHPLCQGSLSGFA